MRREMCEEEYVELLEELAYHVAVIKYLTKQFEDTGWSYPLASVPAYAGVILT